MRFVRFVLPLIAAAPLIGCGSNDVPVPSGGYSVHFTAAVVGSCNVKAHTGQIGTVTTNSPAGVVSDGDGASIACSVTGSGGTFSVDGSARNGADSLDLVIGSISPSATAASPAKGAISFSSTTTRGNAYRTASDTPCDFYFLPGSGEGVDSGKIWVAFSCPKLVYDTYTCAAAQSVALFQNCDTGGQ